MVLERLMTQLWRSPVRSPLMINSETKATAFTNCGQDYMWNKIILHIFAALFSGFTFWKMGNGTFALQLHLFCIFNFVFVAPGCINQMQPFFLHNRDIFETREKKVCIYALRRGNLANVTSLKHITGSPSLVRKLPRRFRI